MTELTSQSFVRANAGKADFEWTYNRLDPRAYFEALGALDYAIPERAAPVFARVFDERLRAAGERELTVLDIGCSYGVNAAILKYGCTMDDLRRRYRGFARMGLSGRDVMEEDKRHYRACAHRRALKVIGIDKAQVAAAYGYWSGLLDDAIAENLEEAAPSRFAAQALRRCDMIISTGVVGYVTEKTFTRLVRCADLDRAPWIASFVLRIFDYAPIARALQPLGYATEKLDGQTFAQRRFADPRERAHVLAILRDRGLSAAGKEAEGHYHAEFYLSRPAADMRQRPLASLFAKTN